MRDRDAGEKAAAPPAPTSKRPAVAAPLSAATYKVTFTASTELRDKLARQKALMRSTGNADDLASVIEAAVYPSPRSFTLSANETLHCRAVKKTNPAFR